MLPEPIEELLGFLEQMAKLQNKLSILFLSGLHFHHAVLCRPKMLCLQTGCAGIGIHICSVNKANVCSRCTTEVVHKQTEAANSLLSVQLTYLSIIFIYLSFYLLTSICHRRSASAAHFRFTRPLIEPAITIIKMLSISEVDLQADRSGNTLENAID